MLIKRERTVALYFLRFLLKFLDASIPSKPNNLYVSFDVFILFFLMLTSPVCLIASIAGLRAALAAGMLADIITVTKHMTAAATSACHVMWSPNTTSTLFTTIIPKNFPVNLNVMNIPSIPAPIPTGIPMMPRSIPSYITLWRICLLVAPTDLRIPNCLVLSLTDIENALYISDTDPNIISSIRMPAKEYNTLLNTIFDDTPENLK